MGLLGAKSWWSCWIGLRNSVRCWVVCLVGSWAWVDVVKRRVVGLVVTKARWAWCGKIIGWVLVGLFLIRGCEIYRRSNRGFMWVCMNCR